MEYKLLVLIAMIFCHIVDDYYLQGWLASAKQKSYWEENFPDKKYKYDYLIALLMHSFSWSFMVMLVPTVYILLNGGTYNFGLLIFNVGVHMFVDNEKANEKSISLVQDQAIHMFQIIITWIIFMS